MDSAQAGNATYRFSAERTPRFLRVTGTGTNSTADLLRFLSDSYQAVRESGSDSVLLVLNFAGPSLSLGSIYDVVAEKCAHGRELRRVACVDQNTEHVADRAEFTELAAIKLGVNFRMFRSVPDAEEWLNAEQDSRT